MPDSQAPDPDRANAHMREGQRYTSRIVIQKIRKQIYERYRL
jgi:hypothetical protein